MPSLTKGVANALGLRSPSGKADGRRSSFVGKSPQEKLSDRLSTSGMLFNKHARSMFGGVSKRLLKCDFGCHLLLWGEIDEASEGSTNQQFKGSTKTMNVGDIISVSIGGDNSSSHASPTFAKKKGSLDLSLCITLKDKERTLDIECVNREDFDFLHSNLAMLLTPAKVN